MFAGIETRILSMVFLPFVGQITDKVAYRRQTNNILLRHVGFLDFSFHASNIPQCKNKKFLKQKIVCLFYPPKIYIYTNL